MAQEQEVKREQVMLYVYPDGSTRLTCEKDAQALAALWAEKFPSQSRALSYIAPTLEFPMFVAPPEKWNI